MSYFLFFSSHFDRDRGLDQGRLSLNHLINGTIDIWVASSSYQSKQYSESFHERGGYLPPQYRIKNLKNYQVTTKPIDLTHTKGVRGNFYQILPYEVVTDKGGQRGDFGIHLDADYPGSLGCIVMNQKRFSQFEEHINYLRKLNLQTIPLFVQYS